MYEEIISPIFEILGGLVTVVTVIVVLLKFIRTVKWRRMLNWDKALRVAERVLIGIQKSGWKPELVIGIGRSGGIWGGWLAGNLGSLPFGVVDDKYTVQDELIVEFPGGKEIIAAILKSHPSIRRILIVEGASTGGQTPLKFKESFSEILGGIEFKFAILYQSPTSTARIDFVGQIGPEPWPEKFPWHSSALYRPYLRDIFPFKKM